jgi:YVTN family beta-propeller protein
MKKLNLAFVLLLGIWLLPPSVLAEVNLTQIGTIAVNGNPFAIALTHDGSKLYVVNFEKNVFVVDTETNTVVATLPLKGWPMRIAITPDGMYAYLAVSRSSGSTSSGGLNRVEVIDISTNSIFTTIPINGVNDYGPTGIAITPDGSEVYVTIRGSDKVVVISTATNTVVSSISLTGSDTPPPYFSPSRNSYHS